MNLKTLYQTLLCVTLVMTGFYFSSCNNEETYQTEQQFAEIPVIVIHIESKNSGTPNNITPKEVTPTKPENSERKPIIITANEKTDYSVSLSEIKKIASNVVYMTVLELDDNDSVTNVFSCTGCVYTRMNGKTYIAIPSHCIGMSKNQMIRIVFPSGEIVEPQKTETVPYGKDGIDAGFLVFKETVPVNGVRNMITLQKPEPGDSIVICGAEPNGDEMVFFRKHAIAYQDIYSDKTTLVSESTGMIGGSSGSALISSKGIIGINVASRIGNNRIEIYTPIEYFEELLNTR